MPFSCHGTSWKLNCEDFLKLPDMIVYIPLHCGNLHKFVCINFSQSLNIDRSSLLVHTVITMWIIVQNFIQLFEFKILMKISTNQQRKHILTQREDTRTIWRAYTPQTWGNMSNVITSIIVSAPNSFLHWIISAHMCFAFSISNFLAFRNLQF